MMVKKSREPEQQAEQQAERPTLMVIRTPFAPFQDGVNVPLRINVNRMDGAQSVTLKKINTGQVRAGCILKSGKPVVSSSDSVKYMLENAEIERGTG